MALYEKPVRLLMRDMVSDFQVKSGETLTKERVLSWFAQKYPLVKEGTISAHLIRLSTNATSRMHYNAKPGDDDLFFQLDGGRFRLYDPRADPAPIYDKPQAAGVPPRPQAEDVEPPTEFAYETDLRDFLAKNLSILEPGLRLYQDEGITGVEFPAGGRFIDILAVDAANRLVVLELKVSRGYDRVVGQLLRYMSWIAHHQAEPGQDVRGIIVAREISDDLLLACSSITNIELFEYQLSVTLRAVSNQHAKRDTRMEPTRR